MKGIVAATAAITLALTACGAAREPTERLHAAADATTAADTAALALQRTMEIGGESAGMDMTMSGEGAFDFADETGWMEMELPGLDAAMRTVFDGDVVYTEMPPMLGPEGRDAQWVRQRTGGLEGVGAQAQAGLGDDPARAIEALAGVDGEVTELGTDEVRGDGVEGYGFTLAGADVHGEAEVPEALAELEIPAEAWLDADDRLRRLVTEIDLGAMMSAAAEELPDEGPEAELGGMMGDLAGTMRVTMGLFDFGEPVDVTIPDEADVIDFEALEQEMGVPGPAGELPDVDPGDLDAEKLEDSSAGSDS